MTRIDIFSGFLGDGKTTLIRKLIAEGYKGEKLVKGNANKIDFASLDCYTDYTIKITYTYDLNDGNGVQTKTIEKSITTLPYIDVTGCSIANTSAVSMSLHAYNSSVPPAASLIRSMARLTLPVSHPRGAIGSAFVTFKSFPSLLY